MGYELSDLNSYIVIYWTRRAKLMNYTYWDLWLRVYNNMSILDDLSCLDGITDKVGNTGLGGRGHLRTFIKSAQKYSTVLECVRKDSETLRAPYTNSTLYFNFLWVKSCG